MTIIKHEYVEGGVSMREAPPKNLWDRFLIFLGVRPARMEMEDLFMQDRGCFLFVNDDGNVVTVPVDRQYIERIGFVAALEHAQELAEDAFADPPR